jgi:hypothetical protein
MDGVIEELNPFRMKLGEKLVQRRRRRRSRRRAAGKVPGRYCPRSSDSNQGRSRCMPSARRSPLLTQTCASTVVLITGTEEEKPENALVSSGHDSRSRDQLSSTGGASTISSFVWIGGRGPPMFHHLSRSLGYSCSPPRRPPRCRTHGHAWPLILAVVAGAAAADESMDVSSSS